jgi:hypothetical protein
MYWASRTMWPWYLHGFMATPSVAIKPCVTGVSGAAVHQGPFLLTPGGGPGGRGTTVTACPALLRTLMAVLLALWGGVPPGADLPAAGGGRGMPMGR